MSCWRPYCAVGVPADASLVVVISTISGIFFCYRNIKYQAGEFEKLSDYRMLDQGHYIRLSDIGPTKKLSVGQLLKILIANTAKKYRRGCVMK